MGCNCKTNRDLAYLRRQYGYTERTMTKQENVSFNIREFAERVLTFVMVLITIPFMFIYLIYNVLSGKTIKIGKMLGLKHV